MLAFIIILVLIFGLPALFEDEGSQRAAFFFSACIVTVYLSAVYGG